MQFIAPVSQRQRAVAALATVSICLAVFLTGALVLRPRLQAPVKPTFAAAEYQAFAASIRAGNGHLALYWFVKGMSPNTRIDGYSALTLAAASRQYRLFPLIVSYGADINAPDAFGTTALTRLCRERCMSDDTCTYRRLTSASWLLRHGANANATPVAAETPLAIATLRGDAAFAKLLRAHGAVDLSTEWNRRALVASAP